jgi:uncharacterized protein (TIGR03118 family)
MLNIKHLFRPAKLAVSTVIVSGIAFAQHYQVTNLVSDGTVEAKSVDPNLVNGWGLSRSSGSPWWVSNNGTGTSTLYNGTGAIQPLVVTIPAAVAGHTGTPTGTIFNGTTEFQIAPGKPALFLFVTEDGTISGWNPGVLPTTAVIAVKTPGAVYKGMTMATIEGKPYLFAVNFHSGNIEVYDGGFHRVRMRERAFRRDDDVREHHDDDVREHEDRDDEDLDNLVPFNIQNVGGTLIVAYAKQDAARHDNESGAGLGAVIAFTPRGRFLRSFRHGPWFNAPWGLVLAPSDFGRFSHSLLVGQFGSGEILAFNFESGAFEGKLKDENDKVVKLDGLWGIGFGNGTGAGSFNTLFFAAGPDGEQHGLFGSLTPVAAELTQGNSL